MTSCSSYTIRPATDADLASLPSIENSAATAFLVDPDLAPVVADDPMPISAHTEYLHEWLSHDIGDGGTWVVVAHSDPQSTENREEEGVVTEIVGFVVTSLLEVRHAGDHHDGFVGGGREDHSDELAEPEVKAKQTRGRRYYIHVHELAIHTSHQRRGLGRQLLSTVVECARTINATHLEQLMHVVGLSLTTFRDLSFNGPFYAKLGFREVEKQKIEDVVGQDGLAIWEEEQERFKGMGNGELSKRRCWMVCDL